MSTSISPLAPQVRAAGDAAVAAWELTDLTTSRTVPWATMSADLMLEVDVMEVVTHTWDLAIATGQPRNWDAEFGTLVLEAASHHLLDEMTRGGDMPFEAMQPVATDAGWRQALVAVRGAVRDEGWLVFEARDPDRRAWERWTKEQTHREFDAPEIGRVSTWTELVDVREPLVSFRHVFRFAHDGSELISDSTLRFRGRDEIVDTLSGVGFGSCSVLDAPDRHGLELVFFAQRGSSAPG